MLRFIPLPLVMITAVALAISAVLGVAAENRVQAASGLAMNLAGLCLVAWPFAIGLLNGRMLTLWRLGNARRKGVEREARQLQETMNANAGDGEAIRRALDLFHRRVDDLETSLLAAESKWSLADPEIVGYLGAGTVVAAVGIVLQLLAVW